MSETTSDRMSRLGTEPLLELRQVTIRYAAREPVTAISSVGFFVNHAERYVVVGPSGCGKSSLLKAIGGFIKPARGDIRLRGKPVDRPSPDRIMVFQEFDQLLAWKTVGANVAFALTCTRTCSRQEAAGRARFYLDKVGLGQFVRAYPHTLSGGMKQRVALARALAIAPQVLLMDEPFAALDALTREKMQQELLALCGDSGVAVVFVTHSIEEACTIGDRILVLSPRPGRVLAQFTAADYPGTGGRAELGMRIRRLLDAGENA